MRKFVILAAAVSVVMAIPSSSMSRVHDDDCDWVGSNGETRLGTPPGAPDPSTNDPGLVVYTGPGGTTGTATQVVGVCLNTGAGGFEGGTLEVGRGTDADTGEATDNVPGTDAYVVADGDQSNANPSDGYVGLSSYETDSGQNNQAPNGQCDGGQGSNGGSCFGVIPTNTGVPTDDLPAEHGVPTPICGNDTGPQWEDSTRDGCSVPD